MAGRKQAEPADKVEKQADNGPYLDSTLAEMRDREMKVLADLPAPAPRGLVDDPEIDPALIEAREAEIKRGDKKLV